MNTEVQTVSAPKARWIWNRITIVANITYYYVLGGNPEVTMGEKGSR